MLLMKDRSFLYELRALIYVKVGDIHVSACNNEKEKHKYSLGRPESQRGSQNLFLFEKWWDTEIFPLTLKPTSELISFNPKIQGILHSYSFYMKGQGAIRAEFGPMSEINFVVITI